MPTTPSTSPSKVVPPGASPAPALDIGAGTMPSMTEAQKKPGVAFRAIIAVVAGLLAYPLSFGPAVWLTSRGYFRESMITSVYMPVLWSAGQAPPLEDALVWWGSLGVSEEEGVTLMFETDEADYIFQFGAGGGEIL